MAISNDVLSSTLRILLDEEVDQLYQATPLLDKMRERGGIETYDGDKDWMFHLFLKNTLQSLSWTQGMSLLTWQ